MENNAYLQAKSWDTDVTVTDTEYIYRMKRSQGFAFSKDFQDYYTMALIIAGRAQYRFGKESITVQAGDIILMHDFIGHDSPTPEALRMVIPELLARGYRFVTVGELVDGD